MPAPNRALLWFGVAGVQLARLKFAEQIWAGSPHPEKEAILLTEPLLLFNL